MTTSELAEVDEFATWDRIVVTRAVDESGDVVWKTATGSARPAVRREAALLSRLRQRGLVEAIELREQDDRSVLVTVDAGRTTLADPSHLTQDELLRALRRAIRATRDLHAAGWAHGAIRAEHVVTGPRGRARLCSLGSASPLDERTTALDGEAALALVDHVATLLPADATRQARWRWQRRRRHLHAVATSHRAAPGAPDLGALLVDLDRIASPGRRPARTRQPVLAVSALTCVCVAAAVAATALLGGGARAVATPGQPVVTSAPCGSWPVPGTDVDGDGCGDLVRIDANRLVIDDRTYRVGVDGDRVAVADWDCDGLSTALLLRPSTGELYDFPIWATDGGPTDGHLIATVPGAVDVSATPRRIPGTPDSVSCDRVEVALPDGTEVDPVPPTPRDPP